MKSVEIRVVLNGYLVLPPVNYNTVASNTSDGFRVFESFEKLVEFLKSSLETPSEWLKREGRSER